MQQQSSINSLLKDIDELCLIQQRYLKPGYTPAANTFAGNTHLPNASVGSLDLSAGKPKHQAKISPAKPKSRIKRVWQSSITGMLFYIILIAVIASALIFTDDDSNIPRDFFGFSGLTVLSESMQDEIPKDSFIIIRSINPNTLQIGDDITFLRNENTTFTHRIIGIYENFGDTGERGFQTQGVNNHAPDQDIVIADNVIGVVIFQSLSIGRFFMFVQARPMISVLLASLAFVLLFGLRLMFSPKRTVNYNAAPNKPKGNPAVKSKRKRLRRVYYVNLDNLQFDC